MRKSRKYHTIPDELETKILSAYGTIKPASISRMLGIKKAKVYTTLRKFQKPLASHSKTEGTKYGKIEPTVRGNHTKRICTPYKSPFL